MITEPKQACLGLDPGLDGGIAFMRFKDDTYQPDKVVVARMFTMPGVKKGREVDAKSLGAFIKTVSQTANAKIVEASVEWLQFMPRKMPGKNGGPDRFMSNPRTEFMLGSSYGKLLAVLECLDIPVRHVYSQTWKKEVLRDRGADKKAAIKFCQETYSDVSLLATARSKVPHDGIADALCLAEYARRALIAGVAQGEPAH